MPFFRSVRSGADIRRQNRHSPCLRERNIVFVLKYRLAVATLVVAAIIYCLMPTMAPSSRLSLPLNPHINLGLDLKGGTQLTLGVDTAAALHAALLSAGQQLRQKAKDADISVLGPKALESGELVFLLSERSSLEAFRSLAAARTPQLELGKARSGSDGIWHVPLHFTPEFARRTEELAVDQVLRTIISRIDQFGVVEPDIRKQQDNQIIIQMPGLSDVQRVVQLLEKTAQLSFHLVRDDVHGGGMPPGVAMYPVDPREGAAGAEQLPLEAAPLLRGGDIADAHPSFDQQGRPMVSLAFTPGAADQFERLTGEHKGRRLAIVLDGVVQSAPVIQEKIGGGSCTITGEFSVEQAQDLAISLRSGSLAAPVHILEERTVGPSLGETSIFQGLLAAAAGALAVMILMPLRYGACGVLANGLLSVTLGLLLAGMAALGATLTLPGIAGIVLTIGMAVDANVLIFERIREELRRGLEPLKAIAAGFERASLSITDANLTTILVAVILYQCGTGPVRGFAVTLVLGILASMFTAIFLCRIVFDLWSRYANTDHLRIYGPLEMQRCTEWLAEVRFLRYARHTAAGAILLLLAAGAMALWQGGLRYGVDFSGGVTAQVHFDERVEAAALQQALDRLSLKDPALQQYGESGTDWQIRFASTDIPSRELGQRLEETLQTAFSGPTVHLERLEMVGPKVGEQLRASALEAIYYALLLITVYISGRFEQRWGTAALLAGALFVAMAGLHWLGVPLEWRIAAALLLTLYLCRRLNLAFASAAVASLLFDMSTTISLIVLLRLDIDLTIVAALLTIIGYSLNDTIVIFDRIREVLRQENAAAPRPLAVIIQQSLGETMSRTLLTAGTTLAATLALLVLGGEILYGFALTMFIGVIMGTWSSLFVAAPVLPLFGDSAAFKEMVTPVNREWAGKEGVV